MTGTRLDRLHAALAAEGLDALIVEGAANLRYLTGYTGSNGLALVGAGGDDRFLTDFRYATAVAEQVDPAFATQIADSGDLIEALGPALPAGRIGFDDTATTVRRRARFGELAGPGVELVAAAGLVEGLRIVKDDAEVAAIAAAAAITDEIYAWLLESGLGGRTEREVAVTLEHEMRVRGASGPSFASIVASGEAGALPHATPREAPIEHGTLVTIDIAAQLEGLAAIAPGRSGREVDAQARAVIEAAGHGEHFGHGLGHGVGLDIHEAPRLARTSGDLALRVGNVVTVEPGVYLPGELGVRIEDLVVVRDGGPQVLSAFTKELLVVD